jgi:hypothetical protein
MRPALSDRSLRAVVRSLRQAETRMMQGAGKSGGGDGVIGSEQDELDVEL